MIAIRPVIGLLVLTVRRFQAIFILFAWLAATGAQWDLEQMFAWGRMYASYSRQMTAGAALEKTFKGELCKICEAVREGRHDQDSNAASTTDAKNPGKQPLKFAPTSSRVVYAPTRTVVGIVASCEMPACVGRSTPPTPPPRLVV